MERCPNCGARRAGGEHCRRCGMDLTRLLAVEHAAHRLIARAVAHLGDGDAAAAVADLARACTLYREPFTDRLLGFARAIIWQQYGA